VILRGGGGPNGEWYRLLGGALVAVSSVEWLVGESTRGESLTLMDEGWVYGLVSCTAIVR
jgi:hypothetical protein